MSNKFNVEAHITINPSRHGYGTVDVNIVHNRQHGTILTFKIYFSKRYFVHFITYFLEGILRIDSPKIKTNSGHTYQHTVQY